jgi:hypothetical protein
LIWTRDIIAYGPEWPALPRRAWPKKSKGEAICAPDGEQRIVRGVINSACEPFAHRIITVPDERSQDYGLRLVIRALALLSCVLLSSFGFAADLVPATAAPSAAVRIDLGATTEPPDWFVVLQGVDAGYFRRSLERSAGDVDATVATLEELTAGLETFCSQRRHTAVTISAMWSLCDPVFLTEMIKAGRETMEFINDDHEVVPNAAARAEIARRIRKVQAVLQSVRKESLDRLVGATTAPLVQVQKP